LMTKKQRSAPTRIRRVEGEQFPRRATAPLRLRQDAQQLSPPLFALGYLSCVIRLPPTLKGMNRRFLDHLARETEGLRDAGLFKAERVLASPQDAVIQLEGGSEVINLCANNYLGLANSPRLEEEAGRAVREHGYGMASVRFICGTQTVHKELERGISEFLGTQGTRSSTRRVGTPTAGCSKPSSGQRTPSSQTRSTTHRSSTVSAFAKRNDSDMPTMTWIVSLRNSKRRRTRGSN
jgi:hypothetical protein